MSNVISYEELETLVLTAKPEKLRETFANYTEQERKTLSVKANKLRSQLYRSKANKDASAQLIKAIEKQGEYCWNSDAQRNATIAAFALCPLSSLKTGEISIFRENKEIWRQVISDRKPDWLDDWLDYDLQQEFGTTWFDDVLIWMEEGACKKPTADGYVQKFASEMMSIQRDKKKPPYPPISERLKSTPILLDDIWRLFEVENQAFNTESWLTNGAPEHYETWTEALLKLSEDGTISRTRLLEASLSGLHEDLKQNQLSGFHKFHTSLKPTTEEQQSLQSEYMSLLCHPIGHVVKFGLTMLTKIEKDGNLDNILFLNESASVFMQDGKGNANTVLKLIKKITKAHENLKLEGLNAALEGLKHQNVDIQDAALDIIESEWDKVDEAFISELHAVSSFTAAAVRTRLSRLLGTNSDTEDGSLPQETIHVEYTTLPNDITQLEVLPILDEITPIQDIDELISTLSHAVEVVDSPDDVERIIDAISRLCENKPDNFDELVSPLKYRLNEGGGLGTSNGIANGWGGLRLSLADLIMTWITGQLHSSPNDKYFVTTEALIPAVERITKIADRVYRKNAAQTLAAPTHSGGWVDPLVWVSRLTELSSTHLNTDREDFCLSLLRLAPDNRRTALAKTDCLPDPIKRIAQFALGGTLEFNSADKSDYDLWITAARCNNPQKDWSDEFESIQLSDSWPDSIKPAICSWKAYIKEHRSEHKWGDEVHVSEWKSPEFEIEIGIAQTENPKSSKGVVGKIKGAIKTALSTDWKKIPTAALSHTPEDKRWWNSDFNTPWVAHWLTYQWPQFPESAYVTGVRQLAARIDENSSTWEPNFGFFYGLFVKNRPWNEPSHLVLCMGLAGKDADARGLAIDAFIEGVENCSLDVETIAKILVQLSESGWLKLNRLGENLLQISQVSPVHSWVTREVLSIWLSHANPKQNNFFKMLEVFLEVHIENGAPLLCEVQEALSNIKGSSKAAKVAKKILASLTAN